MKLTQSTDSLIRNPARATTADGAATPFLYTRTSPCRRLRGIHAKTIIHSRLAFLDKRTILLPSCHARLGARVLLYLYLRCLSPLLRGSHRLGKVSASDGDIVAWTMSEMGANDYYTELRPVTNSIIYIPSWSETFACGLLSCGRSASARSTSYFPPPRGRHPLCGMLFDISVRAAVQVHCVGGN